MNQTLISALNQYWHLKIHTEATVLSDLVHIKRLLRQRIYLKRFTFSLKDVVFSNIPVNISEYGMGE